MRIITKINRVLTLMALYHPWKFESDPANPSWDILLTSPVTEQQQKNNKKNKKNKKAKTIDLHLHADLKKK